MFLKLTLLVTTFISLHEDISYAATHNVYSLINERVKNYLSSLNNTNWLENSNKIGMGYNPLYGSPVCYTGSCQMKGFKRSIFKLKYFQSSPGGCTGKLIAEHVELDCLPSTTYAARTETISTLEELFESISHKVDISLPIKIQPLLFSYQTSIETRYMIDNIIKKEQTTIKTEAEISYAKLSMFEPEMELSDHFIYVINNLPCCIYNTDVEQYIFEYIFDYFGFTFLSEILLGGISQETISVSNKVYKTMITQGIDVENEARIAFFATVGISYKFKYNQEIHNQFISRIKEKHTTKLGGDTSITSIEQWLKTIPSNPIITKFRIRNIFTLLNQIRFPNDSLIENKSLLISQALNRYLTNPIYCYNNCTNHGCCQSTSYFQFGTCQCFQGYSGFDCSIQSVVVKPPNIQQPDIFTNTAYTIYISKLFILQFFIKFLF